MLIWFQHSVFLGKNLSTWLSCWLDIWLGNVLLLFTAKTFQIHQIGKASPVYIWSRVRLDVCFGLMLYWKVKILVLFSLISDTQRFSSNWRVFEAIHDSLHLKAPVLSVLLVMCFFCIIFGIIKAFEISLIRPYNILTHVSGWFIWAWVFFCVRKALNMRDSENNQLLSDISATPFTLIILIVFTLFVYTVISPWGWK